MPKVPSVFRITFNVPAERQYFDDDDKGLRINITDGRILLKVAPEVKGADAVAVEKRQRGGREVTIDGEASDVLLKLFARQGASQARPFFLLHKETKDAWLRIEHFNQDGAPPKFWPHIRVWAPKDTIAPPAIYDSGSDEVVQVLGSFARRIREARDTVTTHFLERRIGRPPKEVSDAERVLTMFEALACEIIPEFNPEAYLQHVQSAMTSLGSLSTEITGRIAKMRQIGVLDDNDQQVEPIKPIVAQDLPPQPRAVVDEEPLVPQEPVWTPAMIQTTVQDADERVEVLSEDQAESPTESEDDAAPTGQIEEVETQEPETETESVVEANGSESETNQDRDEEVQAEDEPETETESVVDELTVEPEFDGSETVSEDDGGVVENEEGDQEQVADDAEPEYVEYDPAGSGEVTKHPVRRFAAGKSGRNKGPGRKASMLGRKRA